MQATPEAKKIYEQIQKKLFYMIPEKWDKVYLYASVMEGMNHLETGEMFFYYFPKGILKKEPINVYEVPNKFNIDEKEYFSLADELYGWIKSLRKEIQAQTGRIWTNLTISIENFKFMVEYRYEDLAGSPYNSYERHLIWRYQYLKTGLNTYNKKERNIILEYINSPYQDTLIDTYIEGIYQNPVHHIITYDKKEEKIEDFIPGNMHNKRKDGYIPNHVMNNQEKEIKNQILNYDKK